MINHNFLAPVPLNSYRSARLIRIYPGSYLDFIRTTGDLFQPWSTSKIDILTLYAFLTYTHNGLPQAVLVCPDLIYMDMKSTWYRYDIGIIVLWQQYLSIRFQYQIDMVSLACPYYIEIIPTLYRYHIDIRSNWYRYHQTLISISSAYGDSWLASLACDAGPWCTVGLPSTKSDWAQLLAKVKEGHQAICSREHD